MHRVVSEQEKRLTRGISLCIPHMPFLRSNNADVIVFQVFDEAYNHCGDDPVGTYITPVPYFVQGYLQQEAQDMYDQGYDYQMPEVSQYAYCTPYQTENQILYFQLGCSDASNQELAVNIYEDNACTVRSQVDGYDDSNIDVSAIQVCSKLRKRLTHVVPLRSDFLFPK